MRLCIDFINELKGMFKSALKVQLDKKACILADQQEDLCSMHCLCYYAYHLTMYTLLNHCMISTNIIIYTSTELSLLVTKLLWMALTVNETNTDQVYCVYQKCGLSQISMLT